VTNIGAAVGYAPVRAIVTGGAGFIGSHVVDALVGRGDDVLVLDDLSHGRRENVHPRARLVVADIRDKSSVDGAFAEHRPEACLHLAAQADVRVSVERPDHDCEVNVLGTIRLLEAAREHATRIVFSSTGGAIYGECLEPASESAAREPLAPYGTAKLAAEEYLATYNRLYGTDHTSLRYGNVYGPRQDPHGEAGVVAIFFGRLARGEAPHVYGDGQQARDYVYVGDVARVSLAALERPSGVFNVGTGIPTSVLRLLEECLLVTGVEVEPVFDPPRLGELQRSVLDPGLAERALGFRAATALTDGLAATWESFRGEGEERTGAN
jgi:UDP-glucose 4-epimerase